MDSHPVHTMGSRVWAKCPGCGHFGKLVDGYRCENCGGEVVRSPDHAIEALKALLEKAKREGHARPEAAPEYE